jgi:cytochrome c-type biogenesis protein
MSGVGNLVFSGPLLLAIPVAVAAGAVTFLSPCVLPLVPGYLSYITGMSGTSVTAGSDPEPVSADESAEPAGSAELAQSAGLAGSAELAETGGQAGPGGGTAVATVARASAAPRVTRRRAVTAAGLFVLGFSVLFALYGAAFGQLGRMLLQHQQGLTRVLGVVVIVLGLLFAGVFDRFSFAGRIVKPSVRPRAGLASAPLLGVLFGLGWTPCAGPTLTAVLTLDATTGTAARGALLAFVYGLGVGIPFLIVAFALDRGMTMFGFARRNARLVTRIGGLLLVTVGVLEVTGVWSSAMAWLQTHYVSGYSSPI